jgi:hypothetical protein
MKFCELEIGDMFNLPVGRYVKCGNTSAILVMSAVFPIGANHCMNQDTEVIPLYTKVKQKQETRMSDIKPGERFKVFGQEFTMLDTRSILVSNYSREEYKYVYVNSYYSLYATRTNEVVERL